MNKKSLICIGWEDHVYNTVEEKFKNQIEEKFSEKTNVNTQELIEEINVLFDRSSSSENS